MSGFEGGAASETDAENSDTVSRVSASVSDTVVNISAPSCLEEGSVNDNELLKGLLTDTFCQVCEAVLLFESQRVSHYEGKKHAQRVRIYLQTKKAEKSKQGQESGRLLNTNVNPEKFCERCNMVFSSPVVARSHYEGKVHAKNMRKCDTAPCPDVRTTAGSVAPLVPAREDAAGVQEDQGQKEGTSSDSLEVDLNDPDKYCRLCTASFNNPLMAQQHYIGRKHQRNQARQESLNKLSKESDHASSLTCPVCCVTLSSVETYQAHMQGSKHYVQEKKVVGLCKSQKKVYDSFQDELADYIQVQKARGLEPKRGPGSEAPAQRKAEEGVNDSGQFEEEPQKPFPPPSNVLPPPPSPPLPFRPPHWRPPFHPQTGHFGFRGRFPLQHQWGKGYPLRPPPLIPGLTGRSLRRGRSPESFSSSSSSDSSSSFSSSSSSSSSESSSDGSRDRRRQRRKRKERTKRRREQEDDPGKDDRRTKRTRKEYGEEQGHAKEARGQRRTSFGEEEGTEEDKERRRWKEKRHRDGDSSEEDNHRSKRRISQKRQRQKGSHHGKRQKGEDKVEWSKGLVEERMEREDELRIEGAQATVDLHTEERAELKERPKHKKEKKKTKEKVEGGDNRTEEEKLWDESILGMF